jgi:hypothetical protein
MSQFCFILRFQRVQKIDVRRFGDTPHQPGIADVGSDAEKWLRALAGLTALTDLDFSVRVVEESLSDDGLRALAGLTALTSLNLGGCSQVSDDGLRAGTFVLYYFNLF